MTKFFVLDLVQPQRDKLLLSERFGNLLLQQPSLLAQLADLSFARYGCDLDLNDMERVCEPFAAFVLSLSILEEVGALVVQRCG